MGEAEVEVGSIIIIVDFMMWNRKFKKYMCCCSLNNIFNKDNTDYLEKNIPRTTDM